MKQRGGIRLRELIEKLQDLEVMYDFNPEVVISDSRFPLPDSEGVVGTEIRVFDFEIGTQGNRFNFVTLEEFEKAWPMFLVLS
jgi:hypothetical protein